MSGNSLETNEVNAQLHRTPIAIIGMASIFPQAKNLQDYWDNILRKIDCITDVPPSRWEIKDYYDPNPRAQDKTYCKRGGFIPDVDFDPVEFGLPPNILESTDVSQLLALVVAKDALDDAGYNDTRNFSREEIGVVLGVVSGQQLMRPLVSRLQYPIWEKVLRSSGLSDEDSQKIIAKIKLGHVEWEENSFPGFLNNVVAGRIANRLDLGGMNCTLDAACASSLSAVKLALSELLEHRASMMLTGGVDIDNSILTYMCFSKTPAFSKGENVRTFDTASDGMMAGEGVGIVVLKRLEDAERDGDRIYAVIKGIGTSSDGRFKSIYAPRPEGQATALRRAYKDAGFSPTTIGLIEAHGTGTVAGDLCETTALRQVFTEAGAAPQSIALGSVKSQIGHTKGAAGSASLIKTALALHHKILPATINVTEPNPKLNLTESPFYLNTETRPWVSSADGTPRRAGISSFGFGGTNFHVVMEEYTGEQTGTYRVNSVPKSIILAADTPEQLLERCQEVAGQLQKQVAEYQPTDRYPAEDYFAQLSAESKAIIPATAARVGFVANSLAEALDLLQAATDLLKKKIQEEAWEHPKGIYYRKSGLDTQGKVVALFSGQGSQYLEMGRELGLNFPEVRSTYSAMDNLFIKDGLPALSTTVFPPPALTPAQTTAQTAALQNTRYAQPAIGVFSASLYKLLKQAGFQPDFVAGHSFGELTALWAADVLEENDYLALVRARGEAMAAPTDNPDFDTGTMLAVKGEITKLREDLKDFSDITLANLNSKTQVVLAGTKPAIARVQVALQSKGYSVVPLPVSAAFHTALVGHAQKPFAEAIHAVNFKAPTVPVYSNTTANPYPTEPAAIQQILGQHILEPVQFQQEIENIYAAGGYFFIEFGPRDILTNLVKDILGNKPYLAVALNSSRQKDSDLQLRRAVIQLRVAGFPLQDADPYQQPVRKSTRKRSMLNMRLNGSNYVNPQTKAAFEKALQDGHHIISNGVHQVEQTPAVRPVEQTPIIRPVEQPATVRQVEQPPVVRQVEQPATARQVEQPTAVRQVEQVPIVTPVQSEQVVEAVPQLQALSGVDYLRSLESVERGLEQLSNHQSSTVQVHGQYLNNQVEYTKTFFQLMQQQQGLLLGGNGRPPVTPPPGVLESLERGMLRFHEHQADTLNTHAQYLNNQADYSKNFFQIVQQQAGLLQGKSADRAASHSTAANRAISNGSGSNGSASHSNGLPASARVVERSIPASPKATPAAIAAPVEVAKVVPVETPKVVPVEVAKAAPVETPKVAPVAVAKAAPVETPKATPAPPAPVAKVVAPPAPQKAAPAQSPTLVIVAPAISVSVLSRNLLEVVSEKTGYPVEMLELEMDMEADLGIDSIKRVEILGAMQERFPELPRINPEELVELRTLGQITNHMINSLQEATVSLDAAPSVDTASVLLDAAPPVDTASLSRNLLEVVSEKTGYPVEMLELEMDMEADLGIDSIKRVEILGAMQERFPSLPRINPEELVELRTLGQITNHMINSLRGTVSLDAAPSVDTASVPLDATPSVDIDPAFLSQNLLEVVSEKTGYPVEMLELEMDMEADLGIDSIKRVEILGAMQERFPSLPRINPEELVELRTLGQITNHMISSIRGTVSLDTAPPVDTAPDEDETVSRSLVRLKHLPPPDYLEGSLPEQYVCLLTDDGTTTTVELSQALVEQGQKVVVLSFPQSVIATCLRLPTEAKRVVLEDLSEVNLEQTLKIIAEKYGPIGGFIHLNPPSFLNQKGGIPFLDTEKDLVKQVFLIAKHLKKSLNDAARKGRSCFFTVARLDGQFGLGQTNSFGAIAGGLFGLTKTLNLEWERVFCRALDLSPDLDASLAAKHILAELHDPNRLLGEVAYNLEGRSTLIGEKVLVGGRDR